LSRGNQLKAQLARRRENESAWLFEIRIEKFRSLRDKHSSSSRRTPGPIASVVVMWKVPATCGNNSPNITTVVMGPGVRRDDESLRGDDAGQAPAKNERLEM
jgi:hypothetical protein